MKRRKSEPPVTPVAKLELIEDDERADRLYAALMRCADLVAERLAKENAHDGTGTQEAEHHRVQKSLDR